MVETRARLSLTAEEVEAHRSSHRGALLSPPRLPSSDRVTAHSEVTVCWALCPSLSLYRKLNGKLKLLAIQANQVPAPTLVTVT